MGRVGESVDGTSCVNPDKERLFQAYRTYNMQHATQSSQMHKRFVHVALHLV